MSENTIELRAFTGLNTRDAPGRISDTALVECDNFDVGRAGELTRRTGFQGLFAFPSGAATLLGYYQTSTHNQLLACVGGSEFWYSNNGGDVWSRITLSSESIIEYGVQYADKFYLVRRDNIILEWNGSSLVVISGTPSGSACFIFKDRLFVLNSYAGALASRLYFSKVGDFSSAGWPATNFIDISPGDGDVLVGMAQVQDVLVIFKSLTTWLLYVSGDPITWTLRNSNPQLGCISKWTPKEIEGTLYFLSLRGVYSTDGITFDEESEAIQDKFIDQIISINDLNKSAAAWWEGKYILLASFTDIAASWDAQANRTWDSLRFRTWDEIGSSFYRLLVYHLATKSWSTWSSSDDFKPFNFLEIHQPAVYKSLLIGTRLPGKQFTRYGKTLYTDQFRTPHNYLSRFKTKEFDFGSSTINKRGKWVGVESEGAGTLEYTNFVNGVAQVKQVISTVRKRAMYKLKGPQYFARWQAEYCYGGDTPVTFYGLSLVTHIKKKMARSGV